MVEPATYQAGVLGDPSVDRSIDVHLSKIRAALGAVHDDGKDLIETVRGVGYRFSDAAPG